MSKIFKGTKTDFSYLVGMSLQGRMPWETLASLLKDLAPTLEETREVISILLKELEVLQSSLQEKELEKFPMQRMEVDIQDQNDIVTFETLNDADEHDESMLETEALVEDIDVIENHKEKDNSHKQMSENDPSNKGGDRSMREIDNEKLDDQSEFEVLRDGVAVTTSKAKSFQCTTCEKIFKKKDYLKIHERIHTGELPFECMACNKRFKRMHHLETHHRIHTGEVPFECETCKNRYKTIGQLKVHERIHTGEMPYECKTCKKRFMQMHSLKTHERIHTGETPYACNTCQKRFKRNSTLRTHEKIHIREVPH